MIHVFGVLSLRIIKKKIVCRCIFLRKRFNSAVIKRREKKSESITLFLKVTHYYKYILIILQHFSKCDVEFPVIYYCIFKLFKI